MHTLVVQIDDNDDVYHKFYKFDSQEEKEKAELEIIAAGYKLVEYEKYQPPQTWYYFSTASNKIESKISLYETEYFQDISYLKTKNVIEHAHLYVKSIDYQKIIDYIDNFNKLKSEFTNVEFSYKDGNFNFNKKLLIRKSYLKSEKIITFNHSSRIFKLRFKLDGTFIDKSYRMGIDWDVNE